MKRETFSSARTRLLNSLADLGWTVSPLLKVPHARSPDGTQALFFRPQALYWAPITDNRSASSVSSDARSTFIDIRGSSISSILELVKP